MTELPVRPITHAAAAAVIRQHEGMPIASSDIHNALTHKRVCHLHRSKPVGRVAAEPQLPEVIAAATGSRMGMNIATPTTIAATNEQAREGAYAAFTQRCDNRQVEAIYGKGFSASTTTMKRTIGLRVALLRELITGKVLTLEHVATSLNPADIMTKALSKPEFNHKKSMLGLHARECAPRTTAADGEPSAPRASA